MEENKNIPTTEGEAITPEAPVTDIPSTDAPPPDLTAGVPQQEQAGATMTEPGDVVVSFDKIEELMAERRAAARDTGRRENLHRCWTTQNGKISIRLSSVP